MNLDCVEREKERERERERERKRERNRGSLGVIHLAFVCDSKGATISVLVFVPYGHYRACPCQNISSIYEEYVQIDDCESNFIECTGVHTYVYFVCVFTFDAPQCCGLLAFWRCDPTCYELASS